MRSAYCLLPALLLASPAYAQTRAPIPPPHQSSVTIPCDPLNLLPGCTTITNNQTASGDLWQKIISVTTPDLVYAKALADASGTPESKLRSQCYAAVIAANQAANGVNLKDAQGNPITLPSPHVITSLEQTAEIIDSIQPASPVISACAAAANVTGQSALQFLNVLLAGVLVSPIKPPMP